MIKCLYDTLYKKWMIDDGALWVLSDTHFSDFDAYSFRGLLNLPIDTFYSNEEFEDDIKRLDEEQIKRINTLVGKKDTLIILGDVGNIECVKKLKTRYKILILGNHDKGASNYKRGKVLVPTPKEILEASKGL